MDLPALIFSALALAQTEPVLVDEEVIEVVVTANRGPSAEHPVAVEVVDRAQIEASGAETVAEVLQEQPGIQVERTVTGTALRLQGMEAEHTLILIDGQRVLGRKDGVIDLDRLQLADVERIEIVKGPSSSLYGSDAMGGVINLITRKPNEPRLAGHLRVGMPARVDADVNLAFVLGDTRHRISVGWHGRDAWDRRTETPSTDASALQQANVGYKGVIEGDVGSLSLDAAYQQRHLQGVDSNGVGAVLDRLQTIEDGRVGLTGTVGERTRFTGMLSGGFYKDQFLSDQRGGKSLDIQSVTHEANTEASAVLSHTFDESELTFGADGLFQYLSSDRLETGTAQRIRGGAFAQATFAYRTRGPMLRLSPGVRGDLDTQFGPAFTPRLATSISWERLVLRASSGLGYRAPDFRELYLLFENPGVGYVVAGNPELKPERSVNATAAVEWTVIDDLTLRLNGYHNEIRNLISIGDTDLEPGAIQRFGYDNIARARTTGGELGVQGRPGPWDLSLVAAATLARDLDKKRQLQGRVPLRVTGALGRELGENLSARMQTGISSPRVFYTSRPDGEEEVVRHPVTATTDLRVRWTSPFDVKFFVGLDNLFAAKGPELAPLAPRMAYIGLDVSEALRNRR